MYAQKVKYNELSASDLAYFQELNIYNFKQKKRQIKRSICS